MIFYVIPILFYATLAMAGEKQEELISEIEANKNALHEAIEQGTTQIHIATTNPAQHPALNRLATGTEQLLEEKQEQGNIHDSPSRAGEKPIPSVQK